MKSVVIILSCLLLLVSVGTAALSCGDNDNGTTPLKTTWRLAAQTQPGTFQTNLLQDFADKVAERSDGRLEITIFSGGSLYQTNEIFDAVSSGAIDLGFTGGSTYVGKAPKTSITGSYTSSVVGSGLTQLVAINTALAREASFMVADAQANKIQHLLWAATGSVDSFFNFPVNTVADLKGKKLGCTQGVTPVVQLLGATPVPMELADFYLSAKTGLVDGWVMCPLEYYVSMKFYEVAPYLVNFQFNTIMSLLMNQESLNALPADLQQIVLDTAKEIETRMVAEVQASDDKDLNTLKANTSVHVKILAGDERAAWFNTAIIPVFTGAINKYLSADEASEVKGIITRVQTTGK